MKESVLDAKITLSKNTYFHIAWAPYIIPLVEYMGSDTENETEYWNNTK